MTQESVIKAHCLCKSVSIETNHMDKKVGACHCSTCRTWGGGPFLAVDCGNEVTFQGEENITLFDSSQWAQRGFCNKCGTHLFYRLNQNNLYIMPVGLFKDETDFIFDHQVCIEEIPDYYRFANDTKDLTGEELFAQFSE